MQKEDFRRAEKRGRPSRTRPKLDCFFTAFVTLLSVAWEQAFIRVFARLGPNFPTIARETKNKQFQHNRLMIDSPLVMAGQSLLDEVGGGLTVLRESCEDAETLSSFRIKIAKRPPIPPCLSVTETLITSLYRQYQSADRWSLRLGRLVCAGPSTGEWSHRASG